MASIQHLHLQYRLWIAELNADITVLRILEDYLADIKPSHNNGDVASAIEQYRQKFVESRTKLDDLRHEMHLSKMKIAAALRNAAVSTADLENEIHHGELTTRYASFRDFFDGFKKNFTDFGLNKG